MHDSISLILYGVCLVYLQSLMLD